MSTLGMQKSEVGEIRPTQALTTYGIGSLVDLPSLTVMVMGLDDWPIAHSEEIGEPRLLRSVQNAMGGQVTRLLGAPRAEEAFGGRPNPFDPASLIGVPVAPFPRWMVCSRCRLLAPLGSGLFEPRVTAYRPDKTCYVHHCSTKGKPPIALPARFLVACKNGHLDDFPWLEFVHQGKDCPGPLKLLEIGATGEAADVLVSCEKCGAKMGMGRAFATEGESLLPGCTARQPHLRTFDPAGCDQKQVRTILMGASNMWFPVLLSALSVPQATDELAQLVEDNWTVLEKSESIQNVTLLRQVGQLRDFATFSDEEIWEAVEAKHAGEVSASDDAQDLKSPEWRVFSNPATAQESRDFKLTEVSPPEGYESRFEKIVLVEKLREVRAMIGFSRIESPRDFDSPFEMPEKRRSSLSRQDPVWVPASEVRGEGIFFQFSEDWISDWLDKNRPLESLFLQAHREWRLKLGLDADTGFPGLRYILLHSFAHAVIRQLSVECGYTVASIAERIYSQSPDEGEQMAGVLIYTAAPDSEGTLGGLCALGQPHRLGRHLDQALDAMRLCSSDPLCSEHDPLQDTTLHRVACHACMFLPETSCERGNKYLDRAVLVETIEHADAAFFGEAE
jgi:hypothetical protein